MFTPTDIEQANNLFVRLLKGELDMREEIETVPKNVRAAFEEMIHLAHETAQSLSSTPDSSDESRFEVVTKHLMCALMKARMEPETIEQTLKVSLIDSLLGITLEPVFIRLWNAIFYSGRAGHRRGRAPNA